MRANLSVPRSDGILHTSYYSLSLFVLSSSHAREESYEKRFIQRRIPDGTNLIERRVGQFSRILSDTKFAAMMTRSFGLSIWIHCYGDKFFGNSLV